MPRKRPYAPLSVSRKIKMGLLAGTLGLSPFMAHSAQAGGTGASVNLYVGYTFGGEHSGVAWGLEGTVDHFSRDSIACGSENSLGGFGGALLRVGFIDLGQPRIVVAGRGGFYDAVDFMQFSGETGLTIRMGERAGYGLHLGGHAQVSLGVLMGNTALGLDEITVAAGAGLPSAAFVGCYDIGRPLRTDTGLAQKPSAHLKESKTGSLALKEQEVTAIWQHRASVEWASVPAFTQLAQQLYVAHAPPSLIKRAHLAAEDELDHAVISAGMASRSSNETLELGEPDTSHRLPVQGPEALKRLAVESWLDGCLGEGSAAAVARQEAATVRDPILRGTQTQIAKDEQAHADLAWDILEWACQQGGKEVVQAVEAVRDLMPPDEGVSVPCGLEDCGLVSSEQMNTIYMQERKKSLKRLDTMLF